MRRFAALPWGRNWGRCGSLPGGPLAVTVGQDRRHDELAPDFEITCTERATAPDQASLRVGHLECE